MSLQQPSPPCPVYPVYPAAPLYTLDRPVRTRLAKTLACLAFAGIGVVVGIGVGGCSASGDADQEIQLHAGEFYRLHQATEPVGALSLRELMTFRPILSVPLFEKLKDASVAEEAHYTNAGETAAPLFEGDLFTARPQGFSAARILDCRIDEDHAFCNVELNAAQKNPAAIIKWKERIFLVHDDRGWMVDDIDYGRNSGPVRQGKLTALLQAGIDRGRSGAAE